MSQKLVATITETYTVEYQITFYHIHELPRDEEDELEEVAEQWITAGYDYHITEEEQVIDKGDRTVLTAVIEEEQCTSRKTPS